MHGLVIDRYWSSAAVGEWKYEVSVDGIVHTNLTPFEAILMSVEWLASDDR